MEVSNINKYISALSNRKVNKFNLITEVLSVLSFDELQLFKSKTPVIFQGLLKLSYLKRRSFSDIFYKGKILWANCKDLYGAITFIVQNNAKDINRYLELKEKLDRSTVLMQYSNAFSLLGQIENEVSVSMISTYYRLRLTRLDKGVTVSTQLYNDICKENKVLSSITNVVFKSASIDLPFESEVERLYKAFCRESETSDFFTAFAFPFKKTKDDKWLRLLPYTSIIDLYEGLVFQLSNLNKEALRSDSARLCIEVLSSIINDTRLHRLYSLVNDGKMLSSFKKYDKEKTLIEKYYSGDFNYVYSNGVDYLKENPLEATIIDIFYKSCIELDKIPGNLFPEGSIAEKIHDFYTLSLTNSDVSEVFRVQVRSMCIAWYAIPSLRHIYQVLYDVGNLCKGNIYDNFWRFSLVPEIRDSSFFEGKEGAIKYLRGVGYPESDSIQVEILEHKRVDIFNQTYRLLYGFEDNEVDSYRDEIVGREHTPFITGCITTQIFNRLLCLEQYDAAISFYVNSLLCDPYIKVPIDKNIITQRLTDNEDALIQNQLELAVFYTMIGAEVYKRYLAYKRYLRQLNVSKASQIEITDSKTLIYFIGKVADRNVLTLHVQAFDKEEDVTNERIELCRSLYKVTSDKKYADEVTSLIKEQEVQALAQQVNDSKIHVDVQSLINTGFSSERMLFDTYSEIDDNLEMFEQKNMEGIIDYIKEQYEGKTVLVRYEMPSVRYKRVLFWQMFLNIRDKFLFDPIFGLDKYLSARIRHGTLITQLRNHFLTHNLVTNKVEGGDYQHINPWTLYSFANLSDSAKESINERMLQFTIWLDQQLKNIKEEKIQIKTERAEGNDGGLFDFSENLMENLIDELEAKTYDSFETFVHSTIDFLWKWTNYVLVQIRDFFQQYEQLVIEEMSALQRDIIPFMEGSSTLINKFKDAITTCKTEFQSDIAVVSSWFKPERSTVRFFTIQQAVDTSLTVINKINQNSLSFNRITINDNKKYKGDYFNAIHDIFHDMMNNILGYETIRPNLKGKGNIQISNVDGKLSIILSNPVEASDINELKRVIEEQKNFPSLIAGGKTRRENNSGCVKIYSTVMYTLGSGNYYENKLENGSFVAHILINDSNLIYYEDTDS